MQPIVAVHVTVGGVEGLAQAEPSAHGVDPFREQEVFPSLHTPSSELFVGESVQVVLSAHATDPSRGQVVPSPHSPVLGSTFAVQVE